MKKLMVFDLQRFALHDGPGIRTTVFLKGCPLDCLWCHNPESKKSTPQLRFLEKKCTSCGQCVTACRKGVHRVTQDGSHTVDFHACIRCGACVQSCYNGALTFYGRQKEPREIMETVLKDRDFYEKSGGGLTVSGGEPMLQFEPLYELLQMAKAQDIHVCLDTSGYAKTENYLKSAPYVDLFLFDYKVTGEEAHRRYTGVSNALILKNLDVLCRSGSRIYLRCPIIPGINDTPEHYQAITELSQKYKTIEQVNLMTYHDMAKGKTAQIGESYALSDLKTVENARKAEIYETVRALGCEKLQEG